MPLPTASIVFLVHNRREELRTSLRKMIDVSDYPGEVEVIVVDNASTDGSGAMVREEFPSVRVMEHERNVGVSGWNLGLAAARGEWVLALDDDCYLPPDGLRRAVEAGTEHGADLVSFKVVSTIKPSFVFTESYKTGLFTFWGCAVLMRKRVVDELGGYDPEIFFWANELEFMLRFFDRGLRHLHFPEVAAQHMKSLKAGKEIGWKPYRINPERYSYIAAKLLQRRDAVEAYIAVVAMVVRDAIRWGQPGALTAVPGTLRGFRHGLRHRQPVRAEVSHTYRRNFVSFASPWWFMPRRWDQWFAERERFYPKCPNTLEFRQDMRV